MNYEVVEARYVRDYVLWLRFRDGSSGEIDLKSELRGPVFEPLKALDAFRQFFIHPDCGTVCWPNNVDIAPEFLHDNVTPAAPPMSSDQQYAETATPSNGATISSGPFAVPDLRRRLPADDVPEISRFFGIVIVMFYDEHGRPHFHARYGGEMVSVEIDSLLVSGQFPGRQLRLVLDWAELHRTELLENWDRARLGLPLVAIEPLR